MGRYGRIWSAVLTALCSCSAIDASSGDDIVQTDIVITCSEMSTKAADPDENIVNDITVMIFDQNGYLEDRRVFSRRIPSGKPEYTCRVNLMKGKKYSIYACANIGQEVIAGSLDEIHELRFHLAYPDEYRTGIPMAGWAEEISLDGETSEIRIPLKRLMSKISLRIDRGGLSEGIEMNVISARIGNCPRSARIFTSNSVASQDECFSAGFARNESECWTLNRNTGDGVSGAISLYMLENMQGEFSRIGISDDSEKVFDELDIRQETCSYLELKLDYKSPSYKTTGKPLIYRFYLGKDRNNLDIERNCHYHITVIPEDDGLSENSWRVDKSGLEEMEETTFFEMAPTGFLQGTVGDKIHVRCRFSPEDAEFEIGTEELESDRQRGIYDYAIDDDGHGVMLTLRSPGTGIVYMSAGEPINEAGMLLIEVNNNIKN